MESNRYFRKALKKMKMKPSEFCRFIGITESYASRILNDVRNMDIYTCFRVAEILNVNPDKLVAMTTAEKEKNSEKKSYLQEKVKEYGYMTLDFNIVILSLLSGATLFYAIVLPNIINLSNTLTLHIMLNVVIFLH